MDDDMSPPLELKRYSGRAFIEVEEESGALRSLWMDKWLGCPRRLFRRSG